MLRDLISLMTSLSLSYFYRLSGRRQCREAEWWSGPPSASRYVELPLTGYDMHRFSCTRARKVTHTTLLLGITHTHKLAHTHAHTCTLFLSLFLSLSRMHTHNRYTHTHTHTHTGFEQHESDNSGQDKRQVGPLHKNPTFEPKIWGRT